MSYSLAESNWLADHGIDDILLAYPIVSRDALAQLVGDDRRRAAITVMVDSIESLDHIDCADRLGPSRRSGSASTSTHRCKVGPVHLGVRRSPVHTARQAGRLAAAIERRPGFDLVGVMFYDAQIAGLPDSSPAVRFVKKRSAAELLDRRRQVVAAVGEHAALEIVNAGGTGSLEVTGADPSITELTAGSGLFVTRPVRRLRRLRVPPRGVLRAVGRPQAGTQTSPPCSRAATSPRDRRPRAVSRCRSGRPA